MKLSEKIKKLIKEEEEEIIPWKRLKERLTLNSVEIDKETLNGCNFINKLDSSEESESRNIPIMTLEEYSRLIGGSPLHSHSVAPNNHREIQQLRSDLAELRRESTWLLNSIFSIVGTAVFVYILVSFYFERIEVRFVCSLVSGLALFFIEMILFIIRS